MVRDLDLPVAVNDARRLEVVVDGLPVYGGAQLAVDTTLVSALHCDGTARRGAANRDQVAFAEPRRRKEPTRNSCSLATAKVGGEVGGRWSDEAVAFIRHLAKARPREEPPVLKRRAEQGWRLRWCGLLACAAARAFAALLLERRVSGGSDGATPSVHEVLNDCRFVGLGLAA